MRIVAIVLMSLSSVQPVVAQSPRAYPVGEIPADSRLGELQTLNGYFPFKAVADKAAWPQRQADIKRRILISQGLWPEPTKTQLNAVVHKRIEFEDYTVEAVYFESIPGHFVTGSLYRPKGKSGPFPAILCPHGHWNDARFYDAGVDAAEKLIATGAERFVNAGRNHIQARCVQLARMGCIAFFYDMTGNCDSIQIGHRPDKSDHLDTAENWGFFATQAELRLENMMGLQTWNSVRSIDFLLEQPDVDSNRIGVTGASGGGTQAMIIAAIDDRVTAAMPCVMVSTAMQGGCTCENAPLMRIDQGNVDIAAAIAPRPLGLTAADDWTRELETKGYPDLQNLYAILGHKNRLTAVFQTHFPHNYNHVNRVVMYGFFNRHFNLGFKEPILERDFDLLSKEQLTVWNEQHPGPSGTDIGDSHEIELLKLATADSDERLADLIPSNGNELSEYQNVVGKAWQTILGRRFDAVGDVKFTDTKQVSLDGIQLTVGRLNHLDAGEQIPAAILKGSNVDQKGVVVWITDSGKSGLLSGDGVIDSVGEALKSGYTVVTADLSGQGEFLKNGEPLESQRMWYQRRGQAGWERFSGYTYGYNHSLFAKRTHDILTLIKHARSVAGKQDVELIGEGRTAGPLVLAARSQAGDTVTKTTVDLKGFRFEDLTKQDAPMFVPGAVKYLDVDGLLSVCAPYNVSASGISDAPVASKVYAAAGASEMLKVSGE